MTLREEMARYLIGLPVQEMLSEADWEEVTYDLKEGYLRHADQALALFRKAVEGIANKYEDESGDYWEVAVKSWQSVAVEEFREAVLALVE